MFEVVKTKLLVPRPRAGLVFRPHLLEALDQGTKRKLTLISAPAGFGKTTLLSEWILHSQQPVAWLSLETGDDDPNLFWAYVIKSIQRLSPDLGSSALALLESPQPSPIRSVLTAFINEMIEWSVEFTVVFDDYHVINLSAIHEALSFLIDHLPENMHLLITTRIDPPLPLARFRAHNQLMELRANDLRFSPEESLSFLNQSMGLHLTAEQVAALEVHTEGWVAGLQIAALSLQDREDVGEFVKTFSGSHRHILGYLGEEVLNQQSEEIIQFLLQTSILDPICAGLCDTVTGQTNGQETLKKLEQDNLFIIPLDDESVWFRYHHLFAEVLQLRLKQTQPERVVELHRRAWKWLYQNNLTLEAVNHAIAGRDFEQAAQLIEQVHAAKWRSGDIRTILAWLAALPEESWRSHPRLWLVQAWAAMTIGELATGDAYLCKAEEALNLLDEETARSIRPEVAAFRACHASLAQDPRAVQLAQQALVDLPDDYWLRGLLVVFLGAAYYAAGDLDTALSTLEATPKSNLIPSHADTHMIHLHAMRGTVYYAKGKLRDALSQLDQALRLAEPGGHPILFVGTLLTYMSLAPVLYERDDLAQAGDEMRRCVSLAAEFGSAEVEIYALSFLVCISLALNDQAAAEHYSDQMNALRQDHEYSSSILAYVDYARFLLLRAQGRLEAAAAWVEAHTNQTGALNPYAFHRLAQPQLSIAQGKIELALIEVEALIREARKTGHISLLIKALVIQALALDAIGRQDEAVKVLENALTLAEPEGYIRSFLDEGEPLQRLLLHYQDTLRALLSQAVDNSTLHRMEYVNRLLTKFSLSTQDEAVRSTPVLEPLSEREKDILRLIATGRSNQEIAEILMVAVSTVKSHINSLYSKLGIQRRTQAVLIARELGLLSE